MVRHPGGMSTATRLRPKGARSVPFQGPAVAGHRLVGWAVALTVLAVWCAVQVLTGTPSSDLAGWVAAVAVGILLPGTALGRAVRCEGAPLVEDLAWGSG